MKKVIDYKALAQKLNELREQMAQRHFTSKEMYTLLVEIGFPKNGYLPKLVQEKGIVVTHNIGKNTKCCFCKDPVHYTRVQSVIEAAHDKVRSCYRKDHPAKESLSEASAVVLLKSLGYKLQKPRMVYDEV